MNRLMVLVLLVGLLGCATVGEIIDALPEPTPTPTPTPLPTPEPTPEPTPDPTPELVCEIPATVSPACTETGGEPPCYQTSSARANLCSWVCSDRVDSEGFPHVSENFPCTSVGPTTCPESNREDYILTCMFDGCDRQRDVENSEERYGAELRSAILRALDKADGLIDDNHIAVEDEILWTSLVAQELLDVGICAKSGGEDSLSRDEVGIYDSTWRGHFDVCVASGAPPGRCFVGPEIRFFIAWGVKVGGAPDNGSGDDSEPSEGVCTARGHVGRTWPTLIEACQFAMDWSHNPGGHIQKHTIQGEIWFEDIGRGWYRRKTCERYDQPFGTRLSGPEWFGVECQ